MYIHACMHLYSVYIRMHQIMSSTQCTDGTLCSPLESAHPLWTFDPCCWAFRQYHICYYVIQLWLIRRIRWYTLILWLSQWGQSPRRTIKVTKQTERVKRCKLTNYEMEEKERKERDGNVGGEGREELTEVIMDVSVSSSMQFDNQRHVALTVWIKIHSSLLSLTADPTSVHLSCPLPIFSSFIPFYYGWTTDYRPSVWSGWKSVKWPQRETKRPQRDSIWLQRDARIITETQRDFKETQNEMLNYRREMQNNQIDTKRP